MQGLGRQHTRIWRPAFVVQLPSSVLVRNSWCGVAIEKARKQWHPPKKVFHPANIESGDRQRFIRWQLSNSVISVRLHYASCSQVNLTIFKGAEENQVQRNVLDILDVATSWQAFVVCGGRRPAASATSGPEMEHRPSDRRQSDNHTQNITV